MTPKQEKFCQLYVELGNASEAYRQAGVEVATGQSKFYTYMLIDPRDQSIFYVGKGTGARIRHHVAGAIGGRIDNPRKCERIISILSDGLKVTELFFSDHECSASAMMMERILIERLKESLTNIISGGASEAERASLMAKQALSKMKSFDEWMDTTSDFRVAAASRWPGGARACYDMVKADLQEFVL